MTAIQKTILLAISLFGLLIPNGIFLYYVAVEFRSLSEVMNNSLAVAFMVDALMATAFITFWYSQNPLGRHSWKLFVVLSLIGGLGFSLPFFYYLNKK
ncbi:hypothetical protein K1X84_07430 [bacterium]|nr:hypothetical protein [bacterium]